MKQQTCGHHSHFMFTALTDQSIGSRQSQKKSRYGGSDKAGMICKWIVPDSSVYYAVTLVSSDAVWLLSHLTVKKGSWVRGMDCAVSALVTQIVRTLQRNKCIFNCSCTEGMLNPFPLGETMKRHRIWLICVQIPWYWVLRWQVAGSNDEVVSPTKQPEGIHSSLIHHTLIRNIHSVFHTIKRKMNLKRFAHTGPGLIYLSRCI